VRVIAMPSSTQFLFTSRKARDMLERIAQRLLDAPDGVTSAQLERELPLARVTINLYLNELKARGRAHPIEQADRRTGRFNNWNMCQVWVAGAAPPVDDMDPVPHDPWAMPAGFFGLQRSHH
jgi:hypothetical protein